MCERLHVDCGKVRGLNVGSVRPEHKTAYMSASAPLALHYLYHCRDNARSASSHLKSNLGKATKASYSMADDSLRKGKMTIIACSSCRRRKVKVSEHGMGNHVIAYRKLLRDRLLTRAHIVLWFAAEL